MSRNNPSLTVVVVGLGYVGLPLAELCIQAGHTVIGYDSNPLREKDSTRVLRDAIDKSALGQGSFLFTSSPSHVSEADVVVICVPTPLLDGDPDLTFVEDAIRSVAEYLRNGALVVLESTTAPGTTEGLLRETIDAEGKSIDIDYFLGYSPERINPGNDRHQLHEIPKVVSGLTAASLNRVVDFYSTIFDKVVAASSPKVAEATKLFENSFRLVNIALVNEFARACSSMGISANEVLDLASTKPFGFMRFDPGLGAGGHCIPVDPTFLTQHLDEIGGNQIDLLVQATLSNRAQAKYIEAWVSGKLVEAGLNSKNLTIGLVGMSYKADVPDLRESRSVELASALTLSGHLVFEFDEFASEGRNIASLGEACAATGIDVWILAQPLARILSEEMLKFFESELHRGAPIFDLTGRVPLEGCITL